MPLATVPPAGSLLAAYAARGEYTDCFRVERHGGVPLSAWIEAFYGSPLFRLERWLLARLAGSPSSGPDLLDLAAGRADRFAVWRVEARRPDEILLAVGATRSWLGVRPVAGGPDGRVALFFGSALVRRDHRPHPGPVRATFGLHRAYSRALLRAAVRQLRHTPGVSSP